MFSLTLCSKMIVTNCAESYLSCESVVRTWYCRYPDGIGVVDVYRALSRLPQADFLTNKRLGIKDVTR